MAKDTDTRDETTRQEPTKVTDLTGNETGTAPADHTVENQSFYNPATVGSGTITEDGTYAPPLPDPTIARGLGPGRTSGGRRTTGSLLGGQTGEDTYYDAESAPATSGVNTGDTDAKSTSGSRTSGSRSGSDTTTSTTTRTSTRDK